MNSELKPTNIPFSYLSNKHIDILSAITRTNNAFTESITVDQKVTVFAALMFYDMPHTYVDGAYIEILEFDDNLNSKVRSVRIDGTLIEQYNKTCAALINHVTGDDVPYAKDDLFASISCAIAKKDYESTTPIQVHIRPTKIQIVFDVKNNPYCVERNPEIERAFALANIKQKHDVTGEITLAASTAYIHANALSCANRLWVDNKRKEAINFLKAIVSEYGYTGKIANKIIEFAYLFDDSSEITRTIGRYTNQTEPDKRNVQPYISAMLYFIRKNEIPNASKIAHNIPITTDLNEILLISRLLRKTNDLRRAHNLLLLSFDEYAGVPRYIHELGIVKKLYGLRTKNMSILKEAATILETITEVSNVHIRAWVWYDLGSIYDVICVEKAQHAYDMAAKIQPNVKKFKNTV